MTSVLALLFAGAAAASAQAPAANLTRIGAAAAVRGLVQATAPGTAVGRVVESGKPLFLNDHVTTDAAGRLQVLLLDQTVFTMGPNSDMVLDEFVYDPSNDSGKVTARVTKGVFRFVTGKVARKDPASMKVNLPVGAIGIRGTIAAGEVSGQGSTVILLGPGSRNNANENPGAVSVSNAGRSVLLSQPGFGTTLAQGQPPTPPVNMSQQLQRILGVLGAGPSGTHASAAPVPGASATQSSGQGMASGGALAGVSGDILNVSNALNSTQQQASQTAATGGVIVDGLSTWDQVRSVQTGQGQFSATGDYFCSGGGLCSVGVTITNGLHFNATVDFSNRAISGSLSLLGGPLNGASTIVDQSFSSLSGNASFALSAPGNSTTSGFDTTTIQFFNRGGVAAKDTAVDLHYVSAFGDTATGTAKGSR